MKYFRIASDLHIEQRRQQKMDKIVAAMLPVDPRDAESVLLLAGDISSVPDQLIHFLQVVEKRFIAVIFVPGNHEYYGHEMADWQQYVANGLHYAVQRTFMPVEEFGLEAQLAEDVGIIATTLWADGGRSLETERAVEDALYDFRVIRDGDKPFTVEAMARLNRLHKEWISDELARQYAGITVVLTHHMPSYQLCHPRFGTSINGGFACDCDDLLYGDTAPALWVHGHTHDTIDRVVGRTRVVCNPAGYHGETNASEYNQYGPKFVSIEELRT